MMTVSSLVTVILLQLPSDVISTWSNRMPTSSVITCPPVKTAISFKLFFLLSPKPGALTAQILKLPLNLFNTNVASASESTSSAMISNGLCYYTTFSSNGRSGYIVDIFFSYIKIKGRSSSHVISLESVTKYGEI